MGVYLINLDGHKWIGTHWIDFHMNASSESASYDDSFGDENISKEIRKFIRNKNIIINIYRIQAYNSIMCGNLCIRFTDFMLKSRSLLD